MNLEADLRHLTDEIDAHGVSALMDGLEPEWIDAALCAKSGAKVRNRKLPAKSVLWLVVGMALFRDYAVSSVVQHLDLVIPDDQGRRRGVVGAAISAARKRLGVAPVEELFLTTGMHWGHEAAAETPWRGLSVYAMDGTSLSVPDTDDNREAFGLPASSRGQAGYPKVRLVALMAARSHVLVDAAFGPFNGVGNGETSLAKPLWDGVPDHSLLLIDRNFTDYNCLHRFRETGEQRHWLMRMKANLACEVVEPLDEGDFLADIALGRASRSQGDNLLAPMRIRVIEYEFDGGPQRLMTSLLDPEQWPADEIIAMYHERWEIEIAYDELKTHMLQRKEALRSKTADGVRQEVCGILLAYNLVRYRMMLAARKLDVEPRQMSFVFSLRQIHAFLIATAWLSSPGTIPKHLERLDEALESALLPPRRTHRRYKRWVKVKMSNYKRNPGRVDNTSKSRKKPLK